MNSDTGWKSSLMGRVARFIGSVKFAVPILTLSAVAMIWGTWVDSTEDPGTAMREVYASWWFVSLMAMICASLILSVAVRYPWQRKHVGFIIVHASLVSLIAVGFFTMYTKVEGRIILDQGESSNRMMLNERWIELVEHRDSGFVQLDSAVLDDHIAGAIAAEQPVEVYLTTPRPAEGEPEVTDMVVLREIWPNSEEVTMVTNDSETPLHAVQIAMAAGATTGDWVGEIASTERPPSLGKFAVRVVPTGQVWEPPSADGPTTVLVDAEKNEHPIPEAGSPLGAPGWTVTSVEYFARATIGAEGIREREAGQPNPAVQLVLTHEDGSVERQIAFESLRDSPFLKQLAGETTSGWAVTYRGESFAEPTLAVMRSEDGRVSAVYAGTDGTRESFEHDGAWPWQFTVAGSPVTIVQDFDRARPWRKLEERPEAESSSPAVVVEAPGTGERVTVRWNTPTALNLGDRTIMLRYGPVVVDLPFTIQLVEFRKLDYPGSEMAMAFESDVKVSKEGGEPFDFKIHMNHPYEQGGWRVYQSGFLSDRITVLSVTKDPGLAAMYLACTTLCIGILVTFYSRSLSWGHPDIPVPFPSADDEEKAERLSHANP